MCFQMIFGIKNLNLDQSVGKKIACEEVGQDKMLVSLSLHKVL